MNRINKIIESSIKVFKDCTLRNGAIVAANSAKSYFPDGAKNYRFVWLRDASFVCLAARILGIDIHEKFFDWCQNVEGWKETGLYFEKYNIRGKKARHNFQPDQNGMLLITLWDYIKTSKPNVKKYEQIIIKTAEGLCDIWGKDHFKIVTQDLWEERFCFPDFKENFTYSLGACSRGLYCAHDLIPNERWQRVADKMKHLILSQPGDFFYRSFGMISDRSIDSSLLGLVWPFGIVGAKEPRMVNTVNIIESKLRKNWGIYRYENDLYDGWMYKGKIQRNKGAGYWSLLNFWMSIYYIEKGDKDKAFIYYKKIIDDHSSVCFIPEQIFDNTYQISVLPLAWSHAMFIIASEKFGLI